MANLHETTIKPPYTNRWGAKPGPDYRRCQGTTRAGDQCRGCAEPGHETCRQHSLDRAMRDAVGAKILSHLSAARQLRNAADELDRDYPGEADDEAWFNRHDATMHETFAAEMQAILYPPAPPQEEIAF